MDTTKIEAMIVLVINQIQTQLAADNFDTALALAELAETLANTRMGMK